MKINNVDKNIWFTADHHFGHANIIRFCDRPFADVDAMNESLIANWNAVVTPKDTVYHLGDLFLTNREAAQTIRSRLNGSICLIRGNHDKTADSLKGAFEWITTVAGDGECSQGLLRVVCPRRRRPRWQATHHSLSLRTSCLEPYAAWGMAFVRAFSRHSARYLRSTLF